MAEGSAPEERTEEPTQRRMEQLRKEGSIHASTELAQVLSLIAGFVALRFIWRRLFIDLTNFIKSTYESIPVIRTWSNQEVYSETMRILSIFAPKIVILAFIVSGVSALTILIQTKWNVKEKKIDLKFSQLNPINGVKKVFSINGLVTTLKAIVKLCLIVPVGYFGLKAFAPKMVMLIHSGLREAFSFLGDAISLLFWKMAVILIALAAFDFFWGKHQWLKTNRMTKDEVKDDRKAAEGDEATKKKIQYKGLSRIAQRIRQSVPQADVVITNPTHFAVALKYDREKAPAPIVVAKGADYMAQRIKEIARESGVPVLERKPLARALYASCEVGSQIPRELFRAVADVLNYVYKLKNPYRRTA